MKKCLYLFLPLIIFTACSGADLVDQVLNTSQSVLGPIQIMALQHLGDGSAGDITADDTKIITNDLGYEVEIKLAMIHFHQLTLVSGGDDPSCLDGFDQVIDLHTTHDLLGEDLLTHILGTRTIPTMNYCKYELMIGSEVGSGHAVKFDHPGEEEGHSEEPQDAFHISGTWTKGLDSGDFSFMGTQGLMIHANFKTKENGELIVHPLHIHEGEDIINILFGTKYDLIFDGVDFQGQSADEQLDLIYHNLETAVHQHTGDHHGSSDDGHDHSH